MKRLKSENDDLEQDLDLTNQMMAQESNEKIPLDDISEDFDIRLQWVIENSMETGDLDSFLKFKKDFIEKYKFLESIFNKSKSCYEKLQMVEKIIQEKIEEKIKKEEIEKRSKTEKAISFIESFISSK